MSEQLFGKEGENSAQYVSPVRNEALKGRVLDRALGVFAGDRDLCLRNLYGLHYGLMSVVGESGIMSVLENFDEFLQANAYSSDQGWGKFCYVALKASNYVVSLLSLKVGISLEGHGMREADFEPDFDALTELARILFEEIVTLEEEKHGKVEVDLVEKEKILGLYDRLDFMVKARLSRVAAAKLGIENPTKMIERHIVGLHWFVVSNLEKAGDYFAKLNELDLDDENLISFVTDVLNVVTMEQALRDLKQDGRFVCGVMSSTVRDLYLAAAQLVLLEQLCEVDVDWGLLEAAKPWMRNDLKLNPVVVVGGDGEEDDDFLKFPEVEVEDLDEVLTDDYNVSKNPKLMRAVLKACVKIGVTSSRYDVQQTILTWHEWAAEFARRRSSVGQLSFQFYKESLMDVIAGKYDKELLSKNGNDEDGLKFLKDVVASLFQLLTIEPKNWSL